MNQTHLRLLAVMGLAAAFTDASAIGSIFITGHDPDFHASLGGNLSGAQRINQVAITYIMDPTFNPYVAGGASKFLFVESTIAPPGGHTVGMNGIVASGYTQGVHFDRHDSSTLNAALNQLGTVYGGIVVASDFGGVLTQAELGILNARAGTIASFINSGGGIYAMAESGSGAGLTTGPRFGFLPIFAVANTLNQSETGFSVTAFGAGLGLTNSDVNGNASHNYFINTGGLNVVDVDAGGRYMSLAGRTEVPEPATLAALSLGIVALIRRRRR